MAYSNGYNLTTVLPKLRGRLAWSTDSTLNTANKTSASGRYFDDGSFHPAVTVPNIKKIATEPIDPNTWDAIFTAKQNAIISKCLNNVFSDPEFKEQVVLYSRDTEKEEEITGSGLAVGYRVQLAKAFDITVQVNSLELYFNEAATFNFYLFKQGSKTALKTKSVTTVANAKTTVELTDWFLNYRESAVYYIMYRQADLATAKAIREQACFTKTLFFRADPFTSDVISGTDFNREELSFSVNDPHGVNIQLSSFHDFTQDILNQPHLFDNLLGLSMAYAELKAIIYSQRSNDTERILKDQIDKAGLQLDMDGVAPFPDSPKTKGLKQELDAEIKRVKESFYPKQKPQVVNLAECS